MIYVDELKDYGWILRGHRTQSCHMFTDGGLEELHIFASKLGMKREWFQDHKNSPHYDLTPSRRKMAVAYGAKETTTKEWLKKERAILVMNIINEAVFEILDPEFSNIEKKILGKIKEEAFSYNSVYTGIPNSMGSLTYESLKKCCELLPKKLPPDPYAEFKCRFVSPNLVESFIKLGATNIDEDDNGGVKSFVFNGYKYGVSKFCPENKILLINNSILDPKIIWFDR